MKKLLAKQLGQALSSLDGASLVDTKTGRISSKKVKKEKTAEQMAMDDAKKLQKEYLVEQYLYFLWGMMKCMG